MLVVILVPVIVLFVTVRLVATNVFPSDIVAALQRRRLLWDHTAVVVA